MKYVTLRSIINDHYISQVVLDLAKVLDVRAVAVRAMLPIVARGEVLLLHLEPVDDRVGVLRYRGREYH